eukprot:16552-Heterococcus_DN1.PRE.3
MNASTLRHLYGEIDAVGLTLSCYAKVRWSPSQMLVNVAVQALTLSLSVLLRAISACSAARALSASVLAALTVFLPNLTVQLCGSGAAHVIVLAAALMFTGCGSSSSRACSAIVLSCSGCEHRSQQCIAGSSTE